MRFETSSATYWLPRTPSAEPVPSDLVSSASVCRPRPVRFRPSGRVSLPSRSDNPAVRNHKVEPSATAQLDPPRVTSSCSSASSSASRGGIRRRGRRPVDRCCYLPREVFFGRLGFAGAFFTVWASDFGRFLPATSDSFPVDVLPGAPYRGSPAPVPWSASSSAVSGGHSDLLETVRRNRSVQLDRIAPAVAVKRVAQTPTSPRRQQGASRPSAVRWGGLSEILW
jgi:hypothetical protein